METTSLEMIHTIPKDKKIILFDGVCNLCNNAVNYVIEHDKGDTFVFASLQSEIGKHLMQERHIDPTSIDSIVMIDPGVAYYQKSTAALEIAKDLTGGYSWLKHFLFLPEVLRDGVYDVIAKNRYKWFGKKESCMIPSPELKSKFLD
ncbi:DCC1-like thiol-disulfide oxidoreductase family protein [Gillisia sp. M10.2A]|uniref:DCC1-like thiol-disulfide oxidoreductase family protein n=1 Tax=Gillisia lutea TaxID=2909668 RepID=A0ABS9EFI3_9FLAO|nr:DCC1-like thiol-disulfide oxidoreductase family protein [Gillisia lutea]MCF4101606.1 DCC1-like thiol-disulfide oxidoreductase family protein [Gillisia lutea]